MVERLFTWISRNRRLWKHAEATIESAAAFEPLLPSSDASHDYSEQFRHELLDFQLRRVCPFCDIFIFQSLSAASANHLKNQEQKSFAARLVTWHEF